MCRILWSLIQFLSSMEKTLEDTLKQLPGLFKERERMLEKREKDLALLKKTLEEEHPNSGEPDDVLLLDVGGTPISVLRRTLTQVEGSMLASKFSGRWDESLEKTPEGRFFIDQSIDLFLPLIDYLRGVALVPHARLVRPPNPPSFQDIEMQSSFYRMVEYYGIGLGVYPVGVYCLGSSVQDSILVATHPDYEVECDEFSTFCVVPLDNRHTLSLKSFQVKLLDVGSVQVGWSNGSTDLLSRSTDGTQGVGYTSYSMALDAARSCVVSKKKMHDLPQLNVAPGSVIRCEENGKSWFVDGKLVASTVTKDNVVTVSSSLQANSIPCVSVKGKIEFTAFDFLYA